MDIQNIIANMVETIKFSKKIKFKTINLENIALHEAQINLKNFLKNASVNDKKDAYNYTNFALNKLVEEKEIFKFFNNDNKTGFIIQPSAYTDMFEIEQYTLIILDDCKDIIA